MVEEFLCLRRVDLLERVENDRLRAGVGFVVEPDEGHDGEARLKKEEVLGLRNTGTIANENIQYPYTRSERLKDFFYYNDFYMFSAFVIVILLLMVLRS